MKTLSSKELCGRGYVNNGDKKTAKFICEELKKNGLKLMNEDGIQSFPISINNIDSTYLALGNEEGVKKIGEEFLVFGSSTTTNLHLRNVKALVFNDKKVLIEYNKAKFNDRVVVFSQKIMPYRDILLFLRDLDTQKIKPKLIIIQGYEKLQYPISTEKYDFATLMLKGEQIKNRKIIYLDLYIHSTFCPNYLTQNIWAKVEGTRVKDSCFMIVSHYDHIGMCGSAVFPGASDNASGVCVNLDLAKYYAKNPQDYTFIFLYCSAEEIGLLGSRYAAQYSFVDLDKVKLLLNIDMCGTGSSGLMVFNGKDLPEAKLFEQINDSTAAFPEIRMRENSCNSDHCSFAAMGVKSLFIITVGKEDEEYHSIYDRGEVLPFTKHIDLCYLIKEFFYRLQR